MVHRLPAVIHDPNTPELLKQAALECFFVHVRTLIEFLGGVRPKNSLDRSAQDTLTNTSWTPRLNAPLKARLNDHWQMASQHLLHFSKNASAISPAITSSRRQRGVISKQSPTTCLRSGTSTRRRAMTCWCLTAPSSPSGANTSLGTT